MAKSFADVMSNKSNGRRRSKVLVCFSPDLAEEYQALLIEAGAAQREEDRRRADGKPVTRRAADDPESTKKYKAAGELVRLHEDAFHEFELEQLRREDWLRLRAAHAPRDKSEEDEGRYNRETFPRAAVTAALLDPEPTDEVLAYLDENLSSGEWNRLGAEVWNLNEGMRHLPKAPELLSATVAGDVN